MARVAGRGWRAGWGRGESKADWDPPVDGTQQGGTSSGEKKDVRGGSMCAWQVGERIPSWSGSGTLSQCPPLAAVVVTHAGLSGKVHHVVLFAGAAGGGDRNTVKEEGRECER